MTESAAAKRTSRYRLWWGVGISVFVIAAVAAGIVMVPLLQQEAAIDQLKKRGFSFSPVVHTSRNPLWLYFARLTKSPRLTQNTIEYRIGVPRGPWKADDIATLDRLLWYEERTPYPLPRCWLHMNVDNLQDGDLDQLYHPYKILGFYTLSPQLTDGGLHQLRRASYITHLHLDAPQITDEGLRYFQGLKEVVALSLNGKGITDEGLYLLRHMSKLQRLKLSSRKITGAGFSHVTGMKALTYLDLSDCSLTDENLVRLKQFTWLRVLMISGTRISDAGLSQLKTLLPGLRVLDIRNTRVTAEGVQRIRNSSILRDIRYP